MESALETTIAVLIFAMSLSWAVLSITFQIGLNSEIFLNFNLLEYSIAIKNTIIGKKLFCQASTDPSYYNISSKISIYFEIKKYELKGGVSEDLLCSKGKEPSEFVNKAEAIGAYLNSSLIIVRVIVYGLP